MTCEICQHWCGHWFGPTPIRNNDGIPIPTNHHPNCPHYNDSLIDVWYAEIDGNKCFCEDEQSCREIVGEEGLETATISQIKMHREVFENLPEFDGF